MDLALQAELVGIPNLSRHLRHLKAFRMSFHRCAALIAKRQGFRFEIDERRLAAAFLDWAELFEREKPWAAAAPRDFAAFASGLLMQEMLRQKIGEMVPLSGPRTDARAANDNSVVAFWPAGFLVASYCVSVLNGVAIQKFAAPFELRQPARDLRVWWSFREGIQRHPSRAIGFFDLFLGNEPQWVQPDRFSNRPRLSCRHTDS